MTEEISIERQVIIDRIRATAGALRGRRHGFAPQPIAGGKTDHRGDHNLNTQDMRHPGPLTPAAVLVPLVDRGEGMTVLLTLRTANLHDHAGQISFPGGHIEPGDPDPEHAALREAFEEVGLPPDNVSPVGRLDEYETRTGFIICPVVAIVRPPFPVKPDPVEVADVFEMPLAFALDRANYRIDSRIFKGIERQFYALPYKDRYIWGATAGMLVNLRDVLIG
ncbi:MAG TPA: CoA pyrophosphatase [Alphaproteobacteria bacterium]|nr:CoA pyrophosphatase [Alphaproteobacteria bacterium]